MKSSQLDLFGADAAPARPAAPQEREPVPEEYVELVRKRLTALVELVKNAPTMPWPDILGAIHADNQFRACKAYLPQDEWQALWDVFDPELDRLYAIMNEGKEMPED